MIAMGNNGGSAMDGRTVAQLLWQLPWRVVAAMGDSNGGSMILLDNGEGSAMDDGMVAAQ
jgi:hypothetical protein